MQFRLFKRNKKSAAPTAAQVLLQSENLANKEQWTEAIRLLEKFNHATPDSAIESRLVDLRLDACKSPNQPAKEVKLPKVSKDYFSATQPIPIISAKEFNLQTLAEGVLGKGALIVRGLIDQRDIDELKNCIDKTLAARVANAQKQDNADSRVWYNRSTKIKGGPAQFDSTTKHQTISGSCWVADSPRSMQILIDLYKRIGLPDMLSQYFGEPATLSVKKWVLRKAAPVDMEAGWHQDGIFLGTDTATVNMWIPLSDCGEGTKSPGIEIIANGDRALYETGSHGADFDWTVGQGLVDNMADVSPVQHPTFAPGDALFFDHFNLHRSGFRAGLSEPRYAVESWFFASSVAPKKQFPMFI
jgi:hypothetical protein